MRTIEFLYHLKRDVENLRTQVAIDSIDEYISEKLPKWDIEEIKAETVSKSPDYPGAIYEAVRNVDLLIIDETGPRFRTIFKGDKIMAVGSGELSKGGISEFLFGDEIVFGPNSFFIHIANPINPSFASMKKGDS